VRDPAWLQLSEVGIGLAWASILAMPYAMLASSLPQAKLGVSMGLFNVFGGAATAGGHRDAFGDGAFSPRPGVDDGLCRRLADRGGGADPTVPASTQRG
jgi:hypothetical protein